MDDFTLENVQKSKFLMGPKWSKNECGWSLGSKEAHKNHFQSFFGNFGQNSCFEKKVSEIPLKCSKMPYFWNFKCGFSADVGR